MGKRFVDTELNKRSMRGMDVKFRFAFSWIWENCDAAGVWAIDLDLFKFEVGYKLDIEGLLKACPRVLRLPNGKLFVPDFLAVNYGTLKAGYNPHKPVFRSLEANGIDASNLKIQDLPNPLARVEEEGEEEDNTVREKERASISWPSWAGPNTLKAWEDFKAYRITEHKQRYKSPTTEQKAVDILAKYWNNGPELVAALEHATGKNWRFPVDPAEYKYPRPEGMKTVWNPRAAI